MSKVSKFTKQNVTDLSTEITQALQAIAAKYQIKIKTNGGKYDDGTATLKLELQTVSAEGIVMTKEATSFKLYATSLNLKPEDLYKEFSYGKETYILVGFSPRKSRFPMLCKKVSDQRQYGLPEDAVVAALNAQRS